MERLCCILDSDESYVVRISACINARKVFPFKVTAFSDLEAFTEFVKDKELELLIVADKLLDKLGKVLAKVTICLREDYMLMEDNGIPGVMKYQASDNVIRDIVFLYDEMCPDSVRGKVKDGIKLISMYSPNGKVYKSTFCLAFAHLKGQKKKTLYINLEEFSAMGVLLPERNGNLSDALYYFNVEENLANSKSLSTISAGNGFDYISPAACAEDLSYFSTDTIIGLINRLGELGSYEIIVIDIGSLIKEPWKLLYESDIILCPKPSELHEERRQLEFEKYLHEAGRSDIVDRINYLDIPYDDNIAREKELNFSKLYGSSLGKLVNSIEV